MRGSFKILISKNVFKYPAAAISFSYKVRIDGRSLQIRRQFFYQKNAARLTRYLAVKSGYFQWMFGIRVGRKVGKNRL